MGGSGACHYIYVDDLGVITCDPRTAASVLSGAAGQFEEAGKALGTQLDLEGLRFTLSPARLWRVRQGVLYALRCRKLLGRAWEVLLGHLAFYALLIRGMMSVFRIIYALINKNYLALAPLWDTARHEMSAAASLLFLMDASWTSPWPAAVVSTDASEEGYGATVSEWGPDNVALVGRALERGRSRGLLGFRPASVSSAVWKTTAGKRGSRALCARLRWT